MFFSDREISQEVRKAGPAVVAVDAPLSLPPGRRWIEDRKGRHFQSCDLGLRKRGVNFFPITLGPMRQLTQRGLKLKLEFSRSGFNS